MTVIRIKRRATGAAGAPSGLKNAELAHNEVDDTLYIGKGDDGSGNATSVVALAGAGAFVDLSSDQDVDGIKAFSSSPTVPTPAASDNSSNVASTEYVDRAVSGASTGAVTYKGTLDASSAAYPSSPAQGDYYIVSVAGTISGHAYAVGDWAVYNGTQWDYIDNSNKVSSVAGRTGVVVLTKSDVSLGNVDNTSDVNKPVSTAVQTALNLKANHVLPSTNQMVYVNSLAGNDTTGDGSYDLPFATVQKALSIISDASLTKPYVIALQAARQIETGDVELKPYTMIVGMMQRATYFRVNSGILKPHSSYGTGNAWAGLKNLYLGGGTTTTFDLQALGGSNSVFVIEDCTITGAFTMKGRNGGAGDSIEWYGGIVLATVTLDSVAATCEGVEFANTVSLTNTQSAGSGAIHGCHFDSSLTLNAYSASLSNVSYAGSSTFTTVGTLSVTSFKGLPKKDKRTLSGGTTLENDDDATMVPYTPTVSGDWSVSPVDVNEALDTLAASLAVIDGSSF